MSCIHYSEVPDQGCHIPCCTINLYCEYPTKQASCPQYLEEIDELNRAIAASRNAVIEIYKACKNKED